MQGSLNQSRHHPRVTISVIIPLFNKEKTVARCIQSVLNQEPWVHEIIVVDDGSTDGSLVVVQQLAQEHSLAILRQENSGPAAARNNGARRSTGSHLIFLDADDMLLPDCLKSFVQALEGAEAASLAQGSFVEVFEDGRNKTHLIRERLRHVVLRESNYVHGFVSSLALHMPPGSFCVASDFFSAIGGFEEDLRCWEISDFMIKAVLEAGTIAILDDPVVAIYKHQSQGQFVSSRKNLTYQIKYANNLVAYLSRIPAEERAPHVAKIQQVLYSLFQAHDLKTFRKLASSSRPYLRSPAYRLISYLPIFLINVLWKMKVKHHLP